MNRHWKYGKQAGEFRNKQIKFYRSAEWKRLREEVRKANKMRCAVCRKLILGKSIVDHIQEITPENIDDPNITLNINNLRLMCQPCHNKRTFKGVSKSKPLDFELTNRKDINLF